MNKLLASLALTAAPLAAFSDVLVDQASTTDPDGYFSDAYSTGGSQTYATTEADTFTLTSTSTLSSINFYGSSENYQNADLTNLASFQIRILDASLSNVLYDATVSTSSLSATATGQTNVGLGTEYAFTLSGLNLDLAAGTYLLNIGAVETDSTSDAFVWSIGSNGNDSHFYNAFDGVGYQGSVEDLAFKINGTQAVPEPASLAVLGLGIVATLRRRTRR